MTENTFILTLLCGFTVLTSHFILCSDQPSERHPLLATGTGRVQGAGGDANTGLEQLVLSHQTPSTGEDPLDDDAVESQHHPRPVPLMQKVANDYIRLSNGPMFILALVANALNPGCLIPGPGLHTPECSGNPRAQASAALWGIAYGCFALNMGARTYLWHRSKSFTKSCCR